jgi:hypothetical protein
MIQKPLLWTGLAGTVMLAAITVMVLALRTTPPPEKADVPCAVCDCSQKSPVKPAPPSEVVTLLKDIVEQQRQTIAVVGKMQERLAVAERRQAALATGMAKSVEDFTKADKETVP